jgi:hypothetical protein
MPRPRTKLANGVEDEIRLRTERRESADTIYAALHGTVSRSKICRMQVEIRNGTAPKPIPSPAPTPKPKSAAADLSKTTDSTDVPEIVPDDTPVEMLDRWIARVEAGAKKAEDAGNLPALSSLAMRAASLAEAKRKATPIPKADPNENPDMKALAAEGEKQLLKRVHALFNPP